MMQMITDRVMVELLKTEIKDRTHFLKRDSAEGKIDQMLYLEAEMEFRAHIWSFDSTHECFHS